MNDVIPLGFNLDKYNNEVLDEQLIRYKDYFDNMYIKIDPNIHLDEDNLLRNKRNICWKSSNP